MATKTDFGTDISCLDDMNETGRLVSGPRMLLEAVYRRLTTPRGSLSGAPNYGYDLRSLLSLEMTAVQRASIPGRIAQEVEKDERIQSCTVRIEAFGPRSLTLSIACTTAEGPFRLTLGVAGVTVKILSSES